MKRKKRNNSFNIWIFISFIIIGLILFALGINQINKEKVANINFIDYNQFNSLYEGQNKSIVVFGKTDCSYCAKYKPILNEIVGEESIKINYLDIDKLTDGEWNKITNMLNSYFKNNEQWGTPLTLIIENEKVINSLMGYNSKDKTLQFYKNNGFNL